MSDRLFRDRRDAGRALAGQLDHYRGRPDLVVLALPRGGVPVGYEVARALGAPLDVLVVRKLGVPGQEDLTMGAVAGEGAVTLDDDVIRGLSIPPEVVEHVVDREGREIPRWERHYRQGRPPPEVTGRIVILVDDGLTTGAGLRAAVKALRRLRPARIALAVPAMPEPTCEELEAEADEVVKATTASPFFVVDQSYWDCTEVTVDEVRDLLRASTTAPPAGAAGARSDDAETIRSEAMRTENGVPEADALFDLVGDAHLVLIGGASCGTHEFYTARAAMTRRLIEEKGFCAVAVQSDWPDAYRVNRYVHGRSEDTDAAEALRGFQRFPAWVWRNTVVLDFVRWLREHNDHTLAANREKIGFFGLDLYNTHRAMDEVITHLERVDPAAAQRARERYGRFDVPDTGDGRVYIFRPACGAGETCENEVVGHLVDLRRHAMASARQEGLLAEDELFYAESNARILKAAEQHYRSMFCGRILCWNLGDRHMADTLDALAAHLGRLRGEPAKIVVWGHNSHLGDARATEAACRGQVSIGRLVRERHPGDCRIIGFTTYTGTVTAVDRWGAPAERKRLRPAPPGSVEELFHEVGDEEFFISFDMAPRTSDVLCSARLERAAGVVLHPAAERRSHCLRARVRDQFDAVIHVDETRALEPVERTARWIRGEVPETSPSGP